MTVRTVSGGNTAATTVKGGVTGTGNLLLNNQSTTAGNRIQFSTATVVNNAGTITCQGAGASTTLIAAQIGANVTGLIQNSATCPLSLTESNLYTGPTTISAGTLKLSGSGNIDSSSSLIVGTAPGTPAILDVSAVGGITIGTGQTLKGHGTITGLVTNNGTLEPGTSIGRLTVSSNLTLTSSSTNIFEVDGTAATNDVVALGGTVTYGGVLKIVPAGTFTNGQTFTLFSGAGATDPSNFDSFSASGATTFSFTNGVLTVVSTGPAAPTPESITTTVSSGNLILSWTDPSWKLATGTNVTAITNIIPGATSPYTNSLSEPKRFYRLVYP